jgi:hypothetical protein
MKRLCRFFSAVTCLASFLAVVPFVGAQNESQATITSQASPALNDVMGARLIAWSEIQKPKPLVYATQAEEGAKPGQETAQAAKAISTAQDGCPQAARQPESVHSSSSVKLDPGGR